MKYFLHLYGILFAFCFTVYKANANEFFFVNSFATAAYSIESACLSTIGMSTVVSANVELHSRNNGSSGLSCHVVYENNQNAWFPIHLISCVQGTQYSGIFKLYCDSPKYQLVASVPKPSCNKQGNPCDVVSGRKTQNESDINSTSLDFTRNYDSGSVDSITVIGANWRHNFDTTINRSPPTNLLYKTVSQPEISRNNRSSVYSKKQDACANGWEELKNIAFRGMLSSQTVQYNPESEVCQIVSSGEVVGHLPIVNTNFYSYPIPSDSIITISRPSGAFYSFQQTNSGGYQEINGYKVRLVKQEDNDFLFHDTDGTIDRFFNNQMIERTLADGKKLSISYTDEGRVNTVSNEFGQTLAFAYNPNGQVESINHPDGQIRYAYDGNFNLSTVTYEDGSTVRYHYENTGLPHHLTGITDQRGIRYATWTYDDQGRATSSAHAGGSDLTTFEYKDTSTVVTDPTGAVREYHLEIQNGQLAVSHITGTPCRDCWKGDAADREYDENGHLSQVTDWQGNITTFVHNNRGQELSRTEASGTPQARTITTEWHPQFNLPVRITGPEREAVMTYDDNGRLTSRQSLPRDTQ